MPMGSPNLRLREARLAAGLTQEQLARLAGIPAGTYRPIESGHRAGNLRTLSRIARALGRTVDELFAPANDAERDGRQAS